MERELILATLTLSLCGPALLVSGSTRPLPSSDGCGRELERSRARRLWWPVAIPVLVFSLLLGWALQEPDVADETVGRVVCAVALVFAMIWVRALARAIISLLPRRGGSGARTVGLLRPRIVIERDLALRLDTRELNAVHAHEQAHARHRDPLRIWLAQLVSDLQWPQPRAIARLASWRHALELSRDEEARASGVDGADLASAIIKAARYRVEGQVAGAALVDAPQFADRIARLLAPVPEPAERSSARWMPTLLSAAIAVAVVIGHAFGEAAVCALPGVQH